MLPVSGDFDHAIGVQLAAMHARVAAGMPRAGWKVCVNDPRMQNKLGLEKSFVGFLDGSRALASGEMWRVDDGAILGVEPEFAIRFAHGIAAGADAGEVRHAIRGVAPAIEVVDWSRANLDLASLAESASFHAGFVTGDLRALDDVPEIGGGCPLLTCDGEVAGTPDAALVPRDLTTLVADVATFLARYGEQIEAGDWLLCGACTNPARVEKGVVVEADFRTLGRVRVAFTD